MIDDLTEPPLLPSCIFLVKEIVIASSCKSNFKFYFCGIWVGIHWDDWEVGLGSGLGLGFGSVSGLGLVEISVSGLVGTLGIGHETNNRLIISIIISIILIIIIS